MKRFKWIAWLLIVLMGITVLAVGCQPAKRPAPRRPAPTTPAPKVTPRTTPAPTTPAPTRPTPTTPAPATNNREIARWIAAVAAKVPGVKSAHVVVTGNTALIGLDIPAGTEAQQTNRIKKEVIDRVKAAEKSITTVSVSTDPDLITRLRRIEQGIAAGRPLSEFAKEITEITRRMAPRVR